MHTQFTPKPCSIEGCAKRAESRGWCQMHYKRWQTTGDPLRTLNPTIEERFWAKVDKAGPVPAYAPELGQCWLWTAYCQPDGYGQFKIADGLTGAHAFLGGRAPKGFEWDHLCRVPSCVRPTHLQLVPQPVNNMRGLSRSAQNIRKTACPKGHPYNEANTYITPQGRRHCRACKAVRDQKR